MKKTVFTLIFGLICFSALVAQNTYVIYGDTVELKSFGGSTDFRVFNTTKDSIGALATNVGDGFLEYKYIDLIDLGGGCFTMSGTKDTLCISSGSSSSFWRDSIGGYLVSDLSKVYIDSLYLNAPSKCEIEDSLVLNNLHFEDIITTLGFGTGTDYSGNISLADVQSKDGVYHSITSAGTFYEFSVGFDYSGCLCTVDSISYGMNYIYNDMQNGGSGLAIKINGALIDFGGEPFIGHQDSSDWATNILTNTIPYDGIISNISLSFLWQAQSIDIDLDNLFITLIGKSCSGEIMYLSLDTNGLVTTRSIPIPTADGNGIYSGSGTLTKDTEVNGDSQYSLYFKDILDLDLAGETTRLTGSNTTYVYGENVLELQSNSDINITSNNIQLSPNNTNGLVGNILGLNSNGKLEWVNPLDYLEENNFYTKNDTIKTGGSERVVYGDSKSLSFKDIGSYSIFSNYTFITTPSTGGGFMLTDDSFNTYIQLYNGFSGLRLGNGSNVTEINGSTVNISSNGSNSINSAGNTIIGSGGLLEINSGGFHLKELSGRVELQTDTKPLKIMPSNSAGNTNDVLKSQGSGPTDGVVWGKVSSDNTTGASGTFTTADSKTVTVTNGIITSIVP